MTTFKKGDRFIPYKPINDKRWEKGMDKYEGHTFTVCDIIDCTDGLAITALGNNRMFLADWCEKVGNSEIPNDHTPMKAGIEMIADEYINSTDKIEGVNMHWQPDLSAKSTGVGANITFALQEFPPKQTTGHSTTLEQALKAQELPNNHIPDVGKTIDWEQRKWEASIAFTAAIISNPNIIDKNTTLKPEWAVELGLKVANKMIKQLKGE